MVRRSLDVSPVPPVQPNTKFHHAEAPAAKASSAGGSTPGSLSRNFCKNCLVGYDRLLIRGIASVVVPGQSSSAGYSLDTFGNLGDDVTFSKPQLRANAGNFFW